MSAEMNLAFSKTVAETLGCSSPADLPCLQKLPLATLYATGKQMRFAPAMPKEGDYPLGKSSLSDPTLGLPQPRAQGLGRNQGLGRVARTIVPFLEAANT